MLYNATILRITPPSPPTTGGTITFTPAEATLGIRCLQSNISKERRYQLGSVIANSTAMIRALVRDMDSHAIYDGYQVQTQLDGDTAETWIVEHTQKSVKDGLSNLVAFLRKA